MGRGRKFEFCKELVEDLWVKVEGREEERNVLERRGKVWKNEKRNKKKDFFFL